MSGLVEIVEPQKKRGRRRLDDCRTLRCTLYMSPEEAAFLMKYMRDVSKKYDLKRFSPTKYIIGIALGISKENLYQLECRSKRNPLYPVYATNREWKIIKEKVKQFDMKSINDFLVQCALAGPQYWTSEKV